MATQGLVSLVEDGKVLVKVVAGCDGYNSGALVSVINEYQLREGHQIYDAAIEVGFGCEDCLVVMAIDGDTVYFKGDEEDLTPLYKETFHQPEFNPRWHYGTAEYTEVISVSEVTQDEKIVV